jgi:hypothetical protein
MGIRRGIGSETFGTQLRCDVCGRPAVWRDRVTTPCCLYGEALCDRCEAKRWVRQANSDEFWADVADFMSLPLRKLIEKLRTDGFANLRQVLREGIARYARESGRHVVRRSSEELAKDSSVNVIGG